MALPKLKTEIKTEWVAALRSGEYEQGIGRLRSCDSKYCCLGVLADKLDHNGWKETDYAFIWEGASTDLEHYSALSDRILLDIFEAGTTIEEADEVQTTLINMNDDYELRQSFNLIADWIEENL